MGYIPKVSVFEPDYRELSFASAGPEPGLDRGYSLEKTYNLEQLRSGDERAWELFYRESQSRLYRTAAGLLGNGEDAEDVVQETFVRAFRKIKHFRGESNIVTWIYRICCNLALDKIRSRRRGIFSRTKDFFRVPAPPRDEPSSRFEISEDTRNLVEKLRTINPVQRVTVVLRHFEGLSYSEIAEITGTSVGTVKSRLFNAREQLADSMGRER